MRIKTSRVWKKRRLNGNIRKTNGFSHRKVKSLSTLSQNVLYASYIFSRVPSRVDPPSYPIQKAESESQASSSVTMPQRWEWYQKQQVLGFVPAALLLINLFYIAFSMARKASFNYQEEWRSHKGKSEPENCGCTDYTRLLSKLTQGPGCAETGAGSHGPCVGEDRSALANSAGMNSQ